MRVCFAYIQNIEEILDKTPAIEVLVKSQF